jgi:hypothetical protein
MGRSSAEQPSQPIKDRGPGEGVPEGAGVEVGVQEDELVTVGSTRGSIPHGVYRFSSRPDPGASRASPRWQTARLRARMRGALGPCRIAQRWISAPTATRLSACARRGSVATLSLGSWTAAAQRR